MLTSGSGYFGCFSDCHRTTCQPFLGSLICTTTYLRWARLGLASAVGGRAEAGPGLGRVMDLMPTHFHQRTPLFTGSYSLVDELLGMETT